MNRVVEIVIAGLLIVLTLPLMAIISFAIKLDSPGPILSRVYPFGGKGGKTPIFTFRTLPHEPRTAGNGSRRTRVGRLLYFTRIDELPVLFNIIHGDLSLAEAGKLISLR